MITIDKSIIVLSGLYPMTDQEKEVLNFDNPTREITILGRTYCLLQLDRSSDGTFKASLMPLY